MSGLFQILNVGAESLYAAKQGVDTTGHNIANAQTEGYSRQRINVKARPPQFSRGLLIGAGAYVESITRSHDQFIENQINRTSQSAFANTAKLDALKQLESIYNPQLSTSVSEELTAFFNSLQDLSNYPEELTVRTNVREAAKNLTSAFKRIDENLLRNRLGFNDNIVQETKQVSDMLGEIASLNIRICEEEVVPGAQANDLRDERERLLRELSKKMQVSYYEDKHGMAVVRGPKDTLLVEAGRAAQIGVRRNLENDGLYDVTVTDCEGFSTRDVTRAIEGGSIKGLLDVRDEIVPDLTKKNNEMAAQIVDSINNIHRQGFGVKDFKDMTGRNFFDPVDDKRFAAAHMQLSDVVSQSTDAISVASIANTPGDNILANDILQLRETRIMDGGNSTFSEFYANYVGVLGIDVLRTEHIKNADDVVLNDLNARREAVSGVSLDEEAVNMLKWQANFTASSKVITTVDEMLDTVLSLKR